MEKMCKNCGTPITKEYCEGYPEVCEHWTPKKPKTNADRIRAMTEEEMAKVPMKWTGYSCVFPNRECAELDTCEKCLLEWLKQPAED